MIKGEGLIELTEKSKMRKIKKYATALLRLWVCRGGFIVGVRPNPKDESGYILY